MGGQVNGAQPLTTWFTTARASASWWTTPANTTTPYTSLWSFC